MSIIVLLEFSGAQREKEREREVVREATERHRNAKSSHWKSARENNWGEGEKRRKCGGV